jgi:pyridoxine kinase
MPTILSVSSQVARGHVGHSAGLFVWQRLGMDVIALPTIILSNRPDCEAWAGERLSPELLERMVAALAANGWLGDIDAVFTGYLPSREHVGVAARLTGRLKTENPELFYCCDPILGDEPGGLYVAGDAANALRDSLLPLADLVTPNRFELGWLTGRRIGTSADAIEAAHALGTMVLATSSPGGEANELVNLLVDGDRQWQAVVHSRDAVPHGTGDFLAALFLARLLRSRTPLDALARAIGSVETLISASLGRDELDLIGSQDEWVDAKPWPVTAGPVDRS